MNAGREVRGDLEDGVVGSALAPQVHEVLPKVLVEVVGGVGVGYHDGEGGHLELAALVRYLRDAPVLGKGATCSCY
jgi:hypothetical protein